MDLRLKPLRETISKKASKSEKIVANNSVDFHPLDDLKRPTTTATSSSAKAGLPSKYQKGTLTRSYILQLKVATNGTSRSACNGCETNEAALLDGRQPSPSDEMTAASDNEELWEELDRPWPATLEIILVASKVR
jgi:lambda repressor-like predicted transcriptional regulator